MCSKCPYSRGRNFHIKFFLQLAEVQHIRFNINIKIQYFLLRNICKESFMSLNFTIVPDLSFLSWLQDCIFLSPISTSVYRITWHTTSENARSVHWAFVQYCLSLSRIRFTRFSIKFLRITCFCHVLKYVKRYLISFVLAKNSDPILASVLNPSCTCSCLPILLSTISVCVLAISTTPYIISTWHYLILHSPFRCFAKFEALTLGINQSSRNKGLQHTL